MDPLCGQISKQGFWNQWQRLFVKLDFRCEVDVQMSVNQVDKYNSSLTHPKIKADRNQL